MRLNAIVQELRKQVKDLQQANLDLRQDNHRYENAHHVLMLDRERLLKRIHELENRQ